MVTPQIDGFRIGQCGWVYVLDSFGTNGRWQAGELVRLIPVGEDLLWALIRTPPGTGLYRLR